MEALVNLIPRSTDLWYFLVIDIVITISLLFTLRLISGKMASVSTSDELCAQDNFAFGVSVAGRMLALCIVLSAAAANADQTDYVAAALSVLLYGLVGLLLIKVGRILHDKIILHRLDKEALIKDRNTGIALVDSASSIATALIISSIMSWVKGTDANALFAIFSGFIVTQAILLSTTRIYERRFKDGNQSGSFQRSLTKGQMALAIQHSGHLLGTAIVVSAASNMLIYNPVGYVSNLTGWLIIGMAFNILLVLLVWVAKRLVLAGLNIAQEVYQQHNVGVASIEMALSVGVALIVRGLVI
ncbi:DUF350 domain-containing protein [Aliiglaciecola sp. LCG003]|uniref:DUF350 domain-containing protein n=1 Tax=Aliiglaciecola sp. LCG003 TaxID=3053655 RepID=UPI0025737540|nr:DUF350 domain-containing protein [Aliiglaciecola sp. LCG003]WJG10432.1 DUF350 domain-containing protein [Aliiglaciecola sp. LCG003]